MVLFSAVFIGVGAIALAIGIVDRRRWRALASRGVKTKGVARAVPDSDDCASLQVTFVDEQGITHEVWSKGGSSDWNALDGQAVDVLYEPGHPERARLLVDLRLRRWLTLVLGLVFCGVGVAVLAATLLGIDLSSD